MYVRKVCIYSTYIEYIERVFYIYRTQRVRGTQTAGRAWAMGTGVSLNSTVQSLTAVLPIPCTHIYTLHTYVPFTTYYYFHRYIYIYLVDTHIFQPDYS